MTEENLKKMWIGKKVISISNGFETDPTNDSLFIGIVVDLIPISMSKTLFPLVKFDDEIECQVSFSTIIEYEDELLSALKKLTAKERWSLIQAFCCRFQSRF